MRKIFGIGQVGVYVSSRATARGDKISMPCAASPPSTFCQEKVATSSFGQSKACANAADVASQIESPVRSAAIQSAFGTRVPDVVPFQVKTMSLAGSMAERSGNSP
jgi:hypothetical protein